MEEVKLEMILVDGKQDQELMFSKERLLLGVSRVADFMGIATLCRIFAGDNKPIEISNGEIIDIKGCAKYMNVSVNWIYKNSHKLPKIQNGKKGKLRFRKSDIDKYLKKHSTPGSVG